MQTMTEHTKAIISARRRNNIYGETTDYIVMSFLALGADGAIYNSAENDSCPITIYGRTQSKMYLVKVLYQETPGATPKLDQTVYNRLSTIALTLGAVPLYALARSYSRQCKFFNIEGERIQNLS